MYGQMSIDVSHFQKHYFMAGIFKNCIPVARKVKFGT